MNTHDPPHGKRRPAKTALRKLQLQRAYCVPSLLQVRKMAFRRCVSCDSPVTNRNLGGNDGRSALSGPVWCLRCADFPSQRLFRFGGSQ